MDSNRQQFLNASLIVGAFFVLSALVTGEWVLFFVAALPPFFTWLFMGGTVGELREALAPPKVDDKPTTPPTAQTNPLPRPIAPAAQNLDAIIAEMDRVLEADAKNAEAYLKRGSAYFGKREWDNALRDMNMAIWLDKNLAPAYFVRGRLLLRRDDAEGALQEFNRALRITPKSAEVYAHRSRLYALIGKMKEAREDAEEAIRLNPDAAIAYASRGYIHWLNGEWAAALEDYDKALYPGGFDAFSLAGRAATLSKLGDAEGARVALRQLQEMHHHYQDLSILKQDYGLVDSFIETLQSINR